MLEKLKRYFHYLIRFGNSKDKADLFKSATVEIKLHGIKTGIQTLLHKKIHGHIESSNVNEYEFIGPISLNIKKYDRNSNICLPIPSDPLVSIIIPMYNQASLTFDCICSIYESSSFSNYEIIIADDNSPEDNGYLKKQIEHVIYIRNESNLGFLNNCNNAAKSAKGKYLVFLNNDTQVQNAWLEELLYIFDNDERAGIVGSKLIYPTSYLQEAGGIIWQDGSGMNYGNGDNPLKPEYNYVKETDYISGASIMITKTLWEKTGGFDTRYAPAYYEDTDLCFQVRSLGYKVIYQPYSVVIHFEGATHGKDLNSGVKHYQLVNQGKFTEKWKHTLLAHPKNAENVFCARDKTIGKKQVLVIDHHLPEIDKDAGSRCISNFIDVMIDLDCSIKFLGENQNTAEKYRKHYQEKGVEVLYGDKFNFSKLNWKNYLMEHLNQLDVILLSRSSVCMPILRFLRQVNYKGNVIYFGHDLGYLRLEQEALLKGRDTFKEEAYTTKIAEDFMYKNADNSLVLSVTELQYLKNYISKPLHYVPAFFFDPPSSVPQYEDREGILFVGGFRHKPNCDAVKWFIDHIYEKLEKQGIRLTIAGSEMPEFIFNYKEQFPSLIILPDLPVHELNELYAKTRIAIVPLLTGAGVKGKVIEAMSKGVPVLGTDIAFEGMPKDNSFLYKGYNSPSELQEHIMHLYSDKEQWNICSSYGQKYVLENFNKEKMRAVFRKIIA